MTLAVVAAWAGMSAQILYKVEGNGLKQASYLFGTHHLAPTSVVEKFGAKAPFESCAQVVGEIDATQDPNAMALVMQPHMIAPRDSTLSKVIAKDDFAVISEEFKKWAPAPGFELPMLDALKPMAVNTMVAVAISREAMPDYDPSDQLDSWFETEGVKRGMKLIPLETVDEQATVLFDRMPVSYQAEALVEMLKNPEKTIKASRQLTAAYMAKDLNKMLQLSEDGDEHPDFMRALLDERNAAWLAKLPGIMSDGPTFVAVGALHLAGENGLVEGLRRAGYTVTAVE